MRTARRSGRFKRDVSRAEKRGWDLSKLRRVLLFLIEDSPLPAELRDHPLKGEWKGYRDLHIEPDWILIYRVTGDEVELVRTGTHADLFGS